MHLNTMFITRDGPIATLHLNRTARLNAFGNQGTIDLSTAANALAQDNNTRIVIITGEGRAFSTGIDLKELSAGQIDMTYVQRWERTLRVFELMDKIVISAINGYCLGGGLQLTLACDLRIAAQSAQLGLPAVKEGLIPGMSVWRLPRFIGLGRARRLILSGELLDARAAQAIGLVDDVVADHELAAYVQATAERYLQVPWAALMLSKCQTNQALDLPFDTFLPEHFAAQAKAMQSEDHHAALQVYRDEQARKRRREP
jgi:enoyl-CoA hydratase/carnithine racemase